MWVNAESVRRAGETFKLNLAVAQAIKENPDEFVVDYAGDLSPYLVKKTPEMVEAYNSLVPEKSQPVVPAETEWVAQTAVPARVGIDQFRYVFGDGTPQKDWAPVIEEDNWCDTARNGYRALDGTILELRCLKEVQP